MTTVPALTAVLLRNRKVTEGDPRFLLWLRARYLSVLRVALRLPAIPVGIGVGLLLLAGVVLPRLGAEFLRR